MNWKLSNLVAPLFLAIPSLAQACPFTMAKTVTQPAYVVGAVADCGGIELTVQGVNIDTRGGCPLTIVVQPPIYSVPEPSTAPTKVELLALQQRIVISYECESSYLLFVIPVGSGCSFVSQQVLAGPHLLQTVPCATKPGADIPR